MIANTSIATVIRSFHVTYITSPPLFEEAKEIASPLLQGANRHRSGVPKGLASDSIIYHSSSFVNSFTKKGAKLKFELRLGTFFPSLPGEICFCTFSIAYFTVNVNIRADFFPRAESP